MGLLKLSIDTIEVEIETHEALMRKYMARNEYGNMYGQSQYLDGLRRALLLVETIYSTTTSNSNRSEE